MIALGYAMRYPDNVRALILMNPTEPGTRFREVTLERREARSTTEVAEEMAVIRESEGFAARDAATLSRFYRLAFRPVMRDPDQVEQVELDLSGVTARNGQDIAALLGQSMGDVDWWDRLGEVAAPTLVLHGRYDAPPADMARELAEALPLGTLAVLETGHFPYVEDREGLLSAVSGFFAGLRR
jgi:pimeloyl-ACP methyl ester carboxylesterase